MIGIIAPPATAVQLEKGIVTRIPNVLLVCTVSTMLGQAMAGHPVWMSVNKVFS